MTSGSVMALRIARALLVMRARRLAATEAFLRTHPRFGGGRRLGAPVGDGQLLGPVEVDHVVHVAVLVDVGSDRREVAGEDLASGRRLEEVAGAQAASTPCSSRKLFSSPAWNISRTM